MDMFFKTVLQAPKRGQKEGQAFALARARLERWEQGQHVEMWAEISWGKKVRKTLQLEAQRLQQANKEGERGRPGKAISRLISPRMASCTRKVEDKLMSKFPKRRAGQMRTRPVLPPRRRLMSRL